MASVAIFNTLEVMRRLRSAGFTEQQTEGIADTLARDALTELMTKTDLEATKVALQGGIASLEMTLTIRMATMLAAAVGVMAAVQRLP